MTGERELLDKAIQRYWLSDDQRAELVDALLPVVDPIANQRAAAELRAAADDVDDGEFSDRWSDAARRAILDRADHLDPS